MYVYSHDRILEALTVNGEISGMQRFEVIVTALKNTDNPALQVCVCVCYISYLCLCVHLCLHAGNELCICTMLQLLTIS